MLKCDKCQILGCLFNANQKTTTCPNEFKTKLDTNGDKRRIINMRAMEDKYTLSPIAYCLYSSFYMYYLSLVLKIAL